MSKVFLSSIFDAFMFAEKNLFSLQLGYDSFVSVSTTTSREQFRKLGVITINITQDEKFFL